MNEETRSLVRLDRHCRIWLLRDGVEWRRTTDDDCGRGVVRVDDVVRNDAEKHLKEWRK